MIKYSLILLAVYFLYYAGNIVYDLFLKKEKTVQTDSVEEFTGKQYGEHPTLIAGRQNAVWVAMDYGTVMVHIFVPETREHYDLEHLWEDAKLEQIPNID